MKAYYLFINIRRRHQRLFVYVITDYLWISNTRSGTSRSRYNSQKTPTVTPTVGIKHAVAP